MSKNYPDTTFEGDPSAPWNEKCEHVCSTCAHSYELFDEFVCTYKLRNTVFFGGMDWKSVLEAIDSAWVFDTDRCGHWEKG